MMEPIRPNDTPKPQSAVAPPWGTNDTHSPSADSLPTPLPVGAATGDIMTGCKSRANQAVSAEGAGAGETTHITPGGLNTPKECTGFSSDVISVDDLLSREWTLWYRKGSGDPWLEQNRSRIVPVIRFLADPGQVLLRVDGTAWDAHIVQWKYLFLEGYDEYSFIRVGNFPTMQVVKCTRTGMYFMRSNWMILCSFQTSFEEMDMLDRTLTSMSGTDSWDRFNLDEATIHNHGYTVPEAPQVVMRLAFALPDTHRMRLYLPPQ